jgi:GNAT superfamily N-acetyltransferase
MTSTVDPSPCLRLAGRADIPHLSRLIESSVRELQRNDYTEVQIEGALQSVYGVDAALIDDGTYFVIEVGSDIVACGGWSKRKKLFGGDDWTQRDNGLLDAAVDAAKIRAFFVDPTWARRGLASMLLDACEDAARIAGFRRLEMAATLTGVSFYDRRGYTEVERIDVPLTNGKTLPVVRMVKG